MTCTGQSFLEAAASFIGVPFRLHGRERSTGIDCVGLVALSLEVIGRPARPLFGYTLRNADIAGLVGHAREAGFSEGNGPIRPGDLLLTRPGPAQFHLLVAAGEGRCIHAHAGLGRVVAGPIPRDWRIDRRWRLDPI